MSPDQVSTPWDILGLFAVTIVAGLATWIVKRITGQAPTPTDPDTDPAPATVGVSIPTADGGHVDHTLPSSLAGAVEDLAATIVSMQTRLAEQAGRIRRMHDRLVEVEEDRDALAEAAAELAAWEDAGRPDPPGAPRLPARVRAILARLHQPTD